MSERLMRLVSLNRERERHARMRRQACKAHLLHRARAAPDELDGFALVMYRSVDNGDGTRSYDAMTHYFVRDALDVGRLPDLARHELETRIARNDDE